MFDVITKTEYFAALDDEAILEPLNAVTQNKFGMKHVQDAWILTQMLGLKGQRVLEVGGGHSRILRCLDPSNTRVNLDKLLGKDGGPKDPPETEGVAYVRANLGEFHPDLEDGSFDYVFSISVMEHIPAEAYPNYWADHVRVLKPGGVGLHAIDIYIGDERHGQVEERVQMYLDDLSRAGLELIGENTLPRPLVFSAAYASHSDYSMWNWNKRAPALAARRAVHQCVSLKLAVRKPDAGGAGGTRAPPKRSRRSRANP